MLNYKKDGYYEQHRLSNGQYCRIEFEILAPGIYNVIFAVANKKKNLKGYFEQTGRNTLTLKSTGDCGIEALLWCRDKLLEAEKEISHLKKIVIFGEDSRRFRVYEKALLRYGYQKQKMNLGWAMVKDVQLKNVS